MDKVLEMQELRVQQARRVRDEAKNTCDMPAFNLIKRPMKSTSIKKKFSTARIPTRRQVILNLAIEHLVANVFPNIGIAEMARVQVQLALRDYVKSAVQ